MWTLITIILGLLFMFFVGVAMLTEIAKIRRALEHMAYKKEIHEIIETDYDPAETALPGEEGKAEPAGGEKKTPAASDKPATVTRYRKTRIKVVEEGE